jgi:hypothetical protein
LFKGVVHQTKKKDQNQTGPFSHSVNDVIPS